VEENGQLHTPANLALDMDTGYEVRHPRCVGSITKNFCVLHNTVEHKYISSSSTLGLQLHVSALYVGHLQVVYSYNYATN